MTDSFTNILSQLQTTTTNEGITIHIPNQLYLWPTMIPPSPPPPTSVELTVQERIQRELAIREECIAADRRARELLLSCMTMKQKSDYEGSHYRWFLVKGNLTLATYKIWVGGRVWCWSRRRWYCLIPHYDNDTRIPADDMALAKKLLIESDEQFFLDTAIGSFGNADE